jgi:hypothetical protein
MIDIGELLLASIGISRVIADDMPKVGKQRMDDAYALELKLPRLASDLVNRKLERTPMTRPHSYRQLLDKLGNLPESVDVSSLVDAFPHEYREESVRFTIAVQHALNDLAAIFPRQSYTTLTGPKTLEPPTVQQTQFYFVLDIVNDPLRAFPLMSCGGLLPRQRDGVRLVFPGISAAIDRDLTDELIKAKARKNTFGLSPIASFGISTWRGQRVANYEPPKPVLPEGTQQSKTKTARPRKSTGKDTALDKATQSQKIDAGA